MYGVRKTANHVSIRTYIFLLRNKFDVTADHTDAPPRGQLAFAEVAGSRL